MADVFISYAHGDENTANQLVRELRASGISVLVDRDVLVAGTDFRHESANFLRSAKIIVLLLSENSKRSLWVQDELSSAIEKNAGTKVISILLDAHAKENWVWPLVSGRESIDLTKIKQSPTEIAKKILLEINPARDSSKKIKLLAFSAMIGSAIINAWSLILQITGYKIDAINNEYYYIAAALIAVIIIIFGILFLKHEKHD